MGLLENFTFLCGSHCSSIEGHCSGDSTLTYKVISYQPYVHISIVITSMHLSLACPEPGAFIELIIQI